MFMFKFILGFGTLVMKTVLGLVSDKERELYGTKDAIIRSCEFKGDADGESALKECSNLKIDNCKFHLRYPLWHLTDAVIYDCEMLEGCRAPLWYAKNVEIESCKIVGVKALRECENISLHNSEVISEEIGWHQSNIEIESSKIEGQYAFFGSKNIKASNIDFKGKYSFQYVENAEIDFSVLHTKDAFWHSKNVTVTDSVIEGEYLGWYSENLTLVHCVISGTQPFINCKNLRLIDCVMDASCDLCFEGSEVNADIRGRITSVKNPHSGKIVADSYDEIILDEQAKAGASCEILIRK